MNYKFKIFMTVAFLSAMSTVIVAIFFRGLVSAGVDASMLNLIGGFSLSCFILSFIFAFIFLIWTS